MSKLTQDDVLKLARLARLSLSTEEIAKFADELTAILAYVEQLQAVDLDGYEPTYQVTGLTNVTRPDVVKQYQADQEALLTNLPNREGDLIKVRRVIT